MNFEKMSEWFFSFSQKVIAYVINAFYILILCLPLILVDFLFKESIFRLPLFFIPLSALYLIALKCALYAWYMIYIKQREYYRGYFFISLKDNFPQVFLYYLITIGLLYIGLNSTYILIGNVSNWFWILFVIIIIFIVPNIIYTTLQFGIYERKSLMETIKNSMILSGMYAVISIALSVTFVFLVYRFQTHPFQITLIGIPAFAGALVFIQKMISVNEKMKKVEK